MKAFKTSPPSPSTYWLYGTHPCFHALDNKQRTVLKLCILQKNQTDFIIQKTKDRNIPLQIVDKKWFESTFPKEAVHQGIALQASLLPAIHLSFLEENLNKNQSVVILDQVSDPHNIGAILRSAAVFGVSAVVMTDKNAPQESAVLAKSACGALELVPLIRTVNLATALSYLKEIGFWCYGFSESGKTTLHQVDFKGKSAIILGAEGEGMRRLTKDLCDFLIRFETGPNLSTLNVSNAAAISLHHVFVSQNSSSEKEQQ